MNPVTTYDQPMLPDPLPLKGEYSKLKVVALFLLFVPVFFAWTFLSLAAWPILKIASCFGAKWALANSLTNECFNLWIAAVHYFQSVKDTVGTGQPILLVHGYLHNSSGWYAMIEEMEKAGFGPIYTIDLGDGSLSGKFWSIEDYAEQLAQKVKEIRDTSGRYDVALIGHSMGGVVSAYYATTLADPGVVSDVITIGSPLQGTPMANYFGVGAAGDEMRTDSPFLMELQEKMGQTPNIRYYSVASETDEVVPFHSAVYGTDATKQMIIPDKGHFSLMISREVSKQIALWLKEHPTMDLI